MPTRALVPWFEAIVYETVPFPEPLLPAVTVSQESLLTAAQEQPLSVETVMLPVAPEGKALSLEEDNPTLHIVTG